MIPFQLFYDITSVTIKYEEGFANVFGHIFTKPEIMWTKADQSLVIPTEYSLCIGFSLQTGTLVLLQCFWNYLANSVARASFMSSKEFMFYIFWTFTSFIIFPVLQYNFSRDIYEPTYKEIMPEMVYGIELFIVACLGVVSHFRFKKLLKSSRDTVNGRSIIPKIRYFQEINLVLSTVLFGHGTLLTILSCDGLTGRKYLNAHKFSADFFICNINMCAVITWFCMILIFHPKQQNPAADEDPFADDTLNNQSGIASTYGQTTTLVITNSMISNEKDLKGLKEEAIHPLSHSSVTNTYPVNYENPFKFGPLPIPPESKLSDRNNTSFSSTAPSMSTLVSQSSPGKDCSKPCTSYFSDQEQALHFPERNPSYTSESYIPPPLSPARKVRDIPTVATEQARRKYSHSMTTSPCTEDVGEFGVTNFGQRGVIQRGAHGKGQNYLSSPPPPSLPPSFPPSVPFS
ncbi:hypothetical protein G6F62_010639 [Rhizopus arrhizus]|nr:hypothetical protein G6F62_010639 [Rhizopus arrhizus]